MIIKKPPNLVIEKNIGRIFRVHNIVEYKSPEDSINIHGYNKGFAYVYLYASLTQINIHDTTLTLVTSRRPVKLLKYLNEDATLKVEKHSEGIYYIHGERIPTQIIITKQLTVEENLWLHALRRGLTEPIMNRITEESKRYEGDLGAYSYAVSEANITVVEGDNEMKLLDKIREDPVLLKRVNETGWGMRIDFEDEIQRNNAKRMLSSGQSYEQISQWLQLPIEKIQELIKSSENETIAVS
jgi:hypothetical protein